MIFILKVRGRDGDEFVNLSHVTSTCKVIDSGAGTGIRLYLVGGGSAEVFGKSAELVRSHLDGMAIDLTGEAPQDRNSALEEC